MIAYTRAVCVESGNVSHLKMMSIHSVSCRHACARLLITHRRWVSKTAAVYCRYAVQYLIIIDQMVLIFNLHGTGISPAERATLWGGGANFTPYLANQWSQTRQATIGKLSTKIF